METADFLLPLVKLTAEKICGKNRGSNLWLKKIARKNPRLRKYTADIRGRLSDRFIGFSFRVHLQVEIKYLQFISIYFNATFHNISTSECITSPITNHLLRYVPSSQSSLSLYFDIRPSATQRIMEYHGMRSLSRNPCDSFKVKFSQLGSFNALSMAEFPAPWDQFSYKRIDDGKPFFYVVFLKACQMLEAVICRYFLADQFTCCFFERWIEEHY